MPDFTAQNRMRDKQTIPRIEEKDAARFFAELERLVDGPGDFVAELRREGFAQFLKKLEERILQLAIQPDAWGERTRARLVAVIMGDLRGVPAESASVEEIVHVSNVVMPCFLLELGRRKQHIAAEFPRDPCDHEGRFGLVVTPSHPMHSITSEQLTRLATELGEELVGLCYFGDPQSREVIEAELNREEPRANSKPRSCRSLSPSSSSSSSPKPKH